MLYCCGSKDEERERAEKEDVLLKREAEPLVKNPGSFHSESEMYGTAGMPELLPPSGVFQPSPHDPCQVPHLTSELNQGTIDHNSYQQRLGRRAPKLGQIGRSKRGECGRAILHMAVHKAKIKNCCQWVSTACLCMQLDYSHGTFMFALSGH